MPQDWSGFVNESDEEKALAEAERQRLAALKQQQKAAASRKPKQNKPKATPAQAARSAQVQAPNDPSGIFTHIGEFIGGLNPVDKLDSFVNDAAGLINKLPDNGVTTPIKNVANEVDRLTPGRQELDGIINQGIERLKGSDNKMVSAAGNQLEGFQAVDLGVRAGAMIPATVAARLAGEATPWSNPPAIIADNPIGTTVFKIAEVLTPTLIGGGVASALGASSLPTSALGLVGESALETATQRTNDDLIAGRQMAQWFGEVADHLGYDGGQLTKELIEGKTGQSAAFTTAVGFLQNLGINMGANQVARWFEKSTNPQALAASDAAKDAAAVLGRNADEVQKSLDNVVEPSYSPLKEPHQAMDVDSQVRVTKPSKGRTAISEEALVAEAQRLRRSGIAEDGLTQADRNYFTNWKALTDEAGLQKVLEEATATLKALKDAPGDLRHVLSRSLGWWENNKGLIDDDLGQLTLNFANDMVKPINDGADAISKLISGKDGSFEKILKEYSAVSEEGFVAATLIGEELGVRIQKAARVAVNLENASSPIHFNEAIDTILDLHDKLDLFLVPLRRGKRKWYIEGQVQQRKALNSVKDSDIQGYIKDKAKPSYDAPSNELTKLHRDVHDPGKTFRELWNAAQDGDEGALQTVKDYLNLISYSEPSQVLKETNNLTRALYDQLLKGNREASAQLFYAYMLSRVSTQVASFSSNVVRLIAEPLGAALSGESAYAKGQIVGLLANTNESLKIFRRAFMENRPLNGATKLDDELYNLKLRNLNLDQRYQGALKELVGEDNDMHRLAASLSYGAQKWANHPLNNGAARLLMASDEATKALFASQVATGRAFKEAAENGTWNSIEAITKKHFEKVFKGGVVDGKIVDADVLDGAKQLTFQQDIPTDGNIIDNMFLAVQNAANSSAAFKFFSPFTRVSWGVLDTVGRHMPIPGSQHLVQRYRKIMRGEMGDVAKLQLESQIALGRGVAMSIVGLSSLGLVTGYNSGTSPKTSFRIPIPGGDDIFIPYARIEPFASIIAVTADAVNGLRDEVISEGQYARYIEEMVFSVGMASMDKTFQSGLTDMAALLDIKNFSEGTVIGLSNSAGSAAMSLTGAAGGLNRMITDWANPYVTISTNSGDGFDTFWAKFRQRQFGGAGNPPLYDELSGELIPKVRTVTDKDNYWAAVGASLVNEFVYPGKIKGQKDDPIRKELDLIGFKPDVATSLRTFEGIPLSRLQQSELSKVYHTSLRPRLERYFNSQAYDQLRKKQQKFRSDNATGSTNEGTRGSHYREQILSDLRKIYREAKIEAVQRSEFLRNDVDFQGKRRAAMTNSGLIMPTEKNQGWQGLLSLTNK